MDAAQAAKRYVAWLERRARWIIAVAVIVAACSVYAIAFRLPVYTDLSHLLPQDAPAVRAQRVVEHRFVASETTIVLVQAPDAGLRARATEAMIARLRALPPTLVKGLEVDDVETRDFLYAHRHLLIPLDDLREVRDRLVRHIEEAKLAGNPLFVDIDEDEDGFASDDDSLEQLHAWRREADTRLGRSANVSADGRTALIVIKTPFAASELSEARAFLPVVEQIADDVERAHPGVRIGLAGGVPTSVTEHAAIIRGIVLSSVITTLLVSLVLFLLLRRLRLLAALTTNIGLATLMSFGLAVLTVGNLNSATAFLGAIIAGNGINFGIILSARFLEERRHAAPSEAMATALATTVRPTLVSAIGASLSYAALTATSFRGFSDFGTIGGAGLIMCWISSYTLLPVLVLRFARRIEAPAGDPVFSKLTARFHVRRPGRAAAVGLALTLAAAVVAGRFIASDPFEYDMTQIRSDSPEAVKVRAWMEVAEQQFGRGLWSKVYVVVDRAEDVAPVLARIRALQATPEGRAVIGSTFSILDVVPPDQPQKLELLDEVRRQLDDPLVADSLEPEDRAELPALRPPEQLEPITVDRIPPELRQKLTERDGRIGTLISLKPPPEFDELDGRNLLRLAAVMEQLQRDTPQAVVAGASLIFADIMRAIRSDGAITTGVAAASILFMVLVVVGPNRRAVAVAISMVAGTLGMVAVCALLGLRVNFLNFIAVPITMGLSIDYAANIATRAETTDPVVTLRTTGSAVLVCSLATMIGYASLLLSDNVALRGFGTASLVGEITSSLAALLFVPAVMGLRRRRVRALAPSAYGPRRP